MKNSHKQPSLFQDITALADAYRGVAVMMLRGARDKPHFKESVPRVDPALLPQRARRVSTDLNFVGKH